MKLSKVPGERAYLLLSSVSKKGDRLLTFVSTTTRGAPRALKDVEVGADELGGVLISPKRIWLTRPR